MPSAPFHLDEAFWRNELVVGTDDALKAVADDASTEAWVEGLSLRARRWMAEDLGVAPGLRGSSLNAELVQRRTELTPYCLVNAFTAGKLLDAIIEVARIRLPKPELDAASWPDKNGGMAYDRLSLTLGLWRAGQTNLKLVFLLDRAFDRGVARMVLGGASGLPSPSAVAATFTEAAIQGLLDAFETKHKTKMHSHCAAVLHRGANWLVSIVRDLKPSFVWHDGRENLFGSKPEWITLEFEPDLRRLKVCSDSSGVPVKIADTIASSIFGADLQYADERLVTTPTSVATFLRSLETNPGRLPVLEVSVANSPLQGSVHLVLSCDTGSSLAPAIDQMRVKYGRGPLDDPKEVESIKVEAFKKRLRLKFDRVEDTPGTVTGFVVRYADQQLKLKERREFEDRMKTEYGIEVLSTEKHRDQR